MPVVRRYNADACWGYHDEDAGLVFDPWLVGSEIDLAPWFHEAWHTGPLELPDALPPGAAVVLSQRWADHDHAPTRAALRGRVAAVFGVPGAAPPVDGRVPALGQAPLTWRGVRLWRVSKPWWRPPAYHAVLACFPSGRAVVHAPHGLSPADADRIDDALAGLSATLDVLAVSFRGYHLPAVLGGDVNPGPALAEAAVHRLAPRHVLQIHDEDKAETGLVARLARRTEPDRVPGWVTAAWGPWEV